MQSVVLLALAAALLAAGWLVSRAHRVAAAAVILVAVFFFAVLLPFDTAFERRMGDFTTYTLSHASFLAYTASAGVRLEAHLSHLTLAFFDQWLGATEETPRRAFVLLSRVGALLLLGALAFRLWRDGASPRAVRYAALTLIAPSTLMIFEFKELGHLSLPWAALALPMLMAGIEREETPTVAAGAAVAGIGAGFHGFGLLSLLGAAAGIAAVVRPWRRMLSLAMIAFAFGTAFYLIWLFVDLTVLGLPISPGHAGGIELRPLVDARAVGRRINYAVFSVVAMKDLWFSAWVAGVPVLAIVAWRARRDAAARLAVAVALPSLAWLIAFWPIQGVGVELDLIVGAFPALYALLWLCARDARSAVVAAVLLAAGHAAFWHVLLDEAFVNRTL